MHQEAEGRGLSQMMAWPDLRPRLLFQQFLRRFRDQLHNLEIVVEEQPSEELLRSEGLDPRCDTLYGIYEGIPLPERSHLDPPLLPDKITIFAEALLEDFPDPQELRDEIRLTVIHEIAHYFGMDDDEIEDLGY